MAAGKAVGLGFGLKNSGLGNGFREVSRAVIHFHADVDGGPAGSRSATDGPRWVRAFTPSRAGGRGGLSIDPNRIDVIVDTTRQLGFGQTTGSRGTLMTAGR